MSKNDNDEVIFTLKNEDETVILSGHPDKVINLLKGQKVKEVKKYTKKQIADFYKWWWNDISTEFKITEEDGFDSAFTHWCNEIIREKNILNYIESGDPDNNKQHSNNQKTEDTGITSKKQYTEKIPKVKS